MSNSESTPLLDPTSYPQIPEYSPLAKKNELKQSHVPSILGYSWSTRKKWSILSVIFLVQCSLNFNASIYNNGIGFLTEKFEITEQKARVGQCVFLICYGLGCELWAPWSEELGRRWTLQASMTLVNVWQVLAAFAPNYATVIAARALAGLSSAGGSVTLGMVADMWDPATQQFAVAFIVFSSVFGSVIGPILGPFIEANLSWPWICWSQLIFGLIAQIAHLLFIPETNPLILLDQHAHHLRTTSPNSALSTPHASLPHSTLYGPNELTPLSERFAPKKVLKLWYRPFQMFFTEPIVLCCSLLSGFSDKRSLPFSKLSSQSMDSGDLEQGRWRGLSFLAVNQLRKGKALEIRPAEREGQFLLALAIGYFVAWASYFPPLIKQRKILAKDPKTAPELRLWWLLYTAPLEPIGLLGFAWTSLGPPTTHYLLPMFFSSLVAIANYSIYMSTIDYMIAAYGPFAASATGGNGLARDFLAGLAALYSTPFYESIPGRYKLEWPSTILAGLAAVLLVPIYVFYVKGQWFRERSKFAQTMGGKEEEADDDE